MSEALPLTRSELAQFLPTPRAIKAFEALFRQAVELPPDAVTVLVEEVSLVAAGADARAQQAIDALNRLAQALELVALAPVVQVGTLGEQQADHASISGGTVTAQLKNNQTVLLETTQALTDGAAAAVGTLTNAPDAGNPTKWVPINDNGTTRYIPTWEAP